MKRPTTLLGRILLDAELQTSVAVERDVATIRHRFEHEGMSFLTITLPSLCDAFDQGLAQGRFTLPMGFKAQTRGGKLPALFSGFFKRVFREDGHLLDSPCILSIDIVRQLTRTLKKVELPCSDERKRAGFMRYIENDESLSGSRQYPSLLSRVAGYLWTDLEGLAERLYCSAGVFGKGATAEHYAFNERHSVQSWPLRSESSFPAAFHALSREDDTDTLAGINFHGVEDELPVRVVQVPKTLKTPRTICVEPSYMMLMQQSIMIPLVKYLESDQFKYKSIRFTDQSVNRALARDGSIDGSLATIDLSDASDLVSNDLVKTIFQGIAPTFLDLIQDCRSTRAKLPDGKIIELKKFASMGSALCFPIEAMVFLTVTIAAMVAESGKRLSLSLVNSLTAKVAIYGDDIIVPTQTASSVCEWLEACGLKVNRNKSFFDGYFRESCGGDYYRGHLVTPAYCRQWDFTGSDRSASLVESYVSLANQLYMKGYWNAAQYIRNDVERRLKRSLPRSRRSNGGLTWASYLYDTRLRWCQQSAGWRVKTFVSSPRRRDDPVLDIRAGMLRSFGPGSAGQLGHGGFHRGGIFYDLTSQFSLAIRSDHCEMGRRNDIPSGGRSPLLSQGSVHWDESEEILDRSSDALFLGQGLCLPVHSERFGVCVERSAETPSRRDSVVHHSAQYAFDREVGIFDYLFPVSSDKESHERTVRPYTLYTKYRWCAANTWLQTWTTP